MTPVLCGAADGTQGDCYRASLATLLNVPLLSVPHFADMTEPGVSFHDLVDEWLRPFGYITANMVMAPDVSIDDVATFWNNTNPGVPAMLGGMTESGNGHTVVIHCGNIYNPSSSPLVAPFPPEGQSGGGWWISTVAVAHNFNPKGVFV